jgi:hypothetical protein
MSHYTLVFATLVAAGCPHPAAETSDAGLVKSAVADQSGALNTCYQQRLNAKPELNGTVKLAWTVHKTSVTHVDVISDTTHDSPLVE